MKEITLAPELANILRTQARELADEYGSTDDEQFIRDLRDLSQALPAELVADIQCQMTSASSDLVLLHGHVIDDVRLGPTPREWKTHAATKASLEYEMLLMLYAGVLGDVFGWANLQSGHLVNDIIPIESFASQQIGASSTVDLTFHTEDAFHPGKADYLCLLCLRNPTCTPTTVASLIDIQNDIDLSSELFGPCVQIAADDAQRMGAEETGLTERTEALADPIPILEKQGSRIHMSIDPAYMVVAGGDKRLQRVVNDFCRAIEDHLTEVPLGPGDLLLLDNHHVVHGRRPFSARYGDANRWLKRVNVAIEFDRRTPYCTNPGQRLLA